MQSSIIGHLADRYAIIEKIGEGNTSSVYKVRDDGISDKTANFFYAAKVYDSNIDFINEINIYNKINVLPCIIRCLDKGYGPFIVDNNSTQNKYYCILEFASHGSLDNYITFNHSGFSENTCKIMLNDIINHVGSLHQKGICHKDIKPDNILLFGNNYQMKLCDFGYSESFLDENNQKIKLKNYYGTKGFYAPELGENIPFDGEKADIFSIGATIFSLLTGINIFDKTQFKSDLYELIKLKKIKKFWKKVDAIINIELSQSFKNLFIKMVRYNPNKRLSLERIRKSEWLEGVQNLNRNIMIDELKERENLI